MWTKSLLLFNTSNQDGVKGAAQRHISERKSVCVCVLLVIKLVLKYDLFETFYT